MPNTKYIELLLNDQVADLGDIDQMKIVISYVLEEPESWDQKQGVQSLNLQLPATKNNDKIFNTYYDVAVQDMTADASFSGYMDCIVKVNGVVLMNGLALLTQADFTDKPESYSINILSGNIDWLLAGQNMTLWDCVNPESHAFTVANVEASWAFDGTSETMDYVYAPVRYRQPFGDNDDAVSIYHLRPSISIYWLLIRGFRQLGYSVNSDFLNSSYFKRLVMPWTWGDFYDVNSQLTNSITFTAAGPVPVKSPPVGFAPPEGFTEYIFFSGSGLSALPSLDVDNTGWTPFHTSVFSGGPGTVDYVRSLVEHTSSSGGDTLYQNFRINNVTAPNGFDNFGLYSFDDTTGTMQYTFNPPQALLSYIGSDISLSFVLNLICKVQNATSTTSVHSKIYIEIVVNGGAPILEPFDELSTNLSGEVKGSLLYPTAHNFIVSNVNVGDVIKMRIKYDFTDTQINCLSIISSGYVNVNPSITGASSWQYNPVTEHWANQSYPSPTEWQAMYSSLQMTGLLIQVGNEVNLQYYDAFRNYSFFDLLRGLVDLFDLEIQTDNINGAVTIEPFSDTTVSEYDSSGNITGAETYQGYFDRTRVNDWSGKRDLNKISTLENFVSSERQLDFNFKQDGSDGGQNIWTARYKGVYLNNLKTSYVKSWSQNNGQVQNGIVAGVPGASRYMFPDRFPQGNRQKANRFFSATMHYKHRQFANLLGIGTPAPQLIAIFPENINDSSASAVTQTFEPKIAFYGSRRDPVVVGAWRWIGDPAGLGYDSSGDAIPTYSGSAALYFPLPFMFSVNYGSIANIYGNGAEDPILSYSDQLVYDKDGNIKVGIGLMRKYFLRRLAIMRNGKHMKMPLRLNLNDMSNPLHRECLFIAGQLFGITSIDDFNALTDDSCSCTMWSIVEPQQIDVDNSYPSQTSILTNPSVLTQLDLKYAQLLLYSTDIPEVE